MLKGSICLAASEHKSNIECYITLRFHAQKCMLCSSKTKMHTHTQPEIREKYWMHRLKEKYICDNGAQKPLIQWQPKKHFKTHYSSTHTWERFFYFAAAALEIVWEKSVFALSDKKLSYLSCVGNGMRWKIIQATFLAFNVIGIYFMYSKFVAIPCMKLIFFKRKFSITFEFKGSCKMMAKD